MEDLAKLQQSGLILQLNVSCHKHQDASRNRGLEVLGTEVDLAGSELQGAHLAHDGLGAHELLALKRQHGRILVQGSQCGAIGLK